MLAMNAPYFFIVSFSFSHNSFYSASSPFQIEFTLKIELNKKGWIFLCPGCNRYNGVSSSFSADDSNVNKIYIGKHFKFIPKITMSLFKVFG